MEIFKKPTPLTEVAPEKRNYRAEVRRAVVGALVLSGCQQVPELMALEQHAAPMKIQNIETQADREQATETAVYKKLESSLRAIGYTDSQIAVFKNEFPNMCVIARVDGTQKIVPLIPKRIFEEGGVDTEIRIYSDFPEKIVAAGFTTKEKFNAIKKLAAEHMSARFGVKTSFIDDPVKANSTYAFKDSIKRNSGSVDPIGLAHSRYQFNSLTGIGDIMINNNLSIEFDEGKMLAALEKNRDLPEIYRDQLWEELFCSVAEHESGHEQGYLHNKTEGSLMFPSVPPDEVATTTLITGEGDNETRTITGYYPWRAALEIDDDPTTTLFHGMHDALAYIQKTSHISWSSSAK